MAREYRLISSDGHLEVPPERWTPRVPKQYQDRAPRTVRLPDGGDGLLIEGLPVQAANFLDLRAGRAPQQWQPFGLRVADAAGTGSPEQRVKEQDMDGLDAAVLFTAMLAVPVVGIFDRWAGLVATKASRLFVYPKEDPALMRRLRRGLLEWVSFFGLPPAVSIGQLVLLSVFDRFPALKIFFAETRFGWVPFWLEAADLWYQRHVGWAEEYLGVKPLQRLPSEYVRDHIYFSVQYERVAVETRHHIGVERIMFATDFPHIECEWPNSQPLIQGIYADVPED